MSELTGKQLSDIGEVMFGSSWKKPLAEQLDVSVTRVYQLAAMDTVPSKPARRLLEAYDSWKQSNGVADNPIVGVTPIATTVITQKAAEEQLSDVQILDRVNKRFAILNRMTDGVIDGKVRSVVVFGAPGVGKTYTIEQALEKAKSDKKIIDYTIIRGTCSAVGLYQALYHARDGGVVVLDDCDSVFSDEEAFNILKTALDSTNSRTIAWRKNASWVYDASADDGRIQNDTDRLPNKFDFEGGVIFITNVDFREKISQQVKLAPHFEALFSRSMYLDLTLKSMRARMLRIKDVFFSSMKKIEKLTDTEADEIFEYVSANADRLNELSLRTVKHICQLYRLGPDWKEIVEYTKMKYPLVPTCDIELTA